MTDSGCVQTTAVQSGPGGPPASAGITWPNGAVATSAPGTAVWATRRASISTLKSAMKYTRCRLLTALIRA